MLTSKVVVYLATAMLLLMVFSFVVTSTPDRPSVLATWTSRPSTSTVDQQGLLDDAQSSINLGTAGAEAHPPRPAAKQSVQNTQQTASLPEPAAKSGQLPTFPESLKISHENDGMPTLSTRGNGSVVMVTGATDMIHFLGVTDLYSKITSNRLEYARAHGYELMIVDLASYVITLTTHPVWGKLPAILEAMDTYPNAEWIWWLDSDAIIMNAKLDLHNLLLDHKVLPSRLLLNEPLLAPSNEGDAIDSGIKLSQTSDTSQLDLIVSQDHNGLNAGSIFIRNTPSMRMLIDLWSDPLIVEREPSWTRREQDALTYLLLNHPTLRRRTGFVHQNLINAFSEGRLFQKYEEGDLLVHFAGCWVLERCSEWFDDFWARRSSI